MTPTTWVLVVFGVAVAFVVASFTCVVVDRMPVPLDGPNEYGESWTTRPWSEVVGGTSRCSSCGAGVRWYHNVPVLGWLVLRGRCADCGERIPAFHPVVELLVPALAVAVGWAVVDAAGGPTWALLPFLWAVPVCVAAAVVDLRTLIVPTAIVRPATAVLWVLCVVAAVAEGHPGWLWGVPAGVVGLAGPLFAVWWVVPSGMGFGDVRLSVFLGSLLGLGAGVAGAGWPYALLLGVLTLALASVVGLVVAVPALLVGRRRVPFGPPLAAATLFCAALAGPVLDSFR